MLRIPWFVPLAVVTMLGVAVAAPPDLWVTDDAVYDVERSGDVLFLGGSFRRVGPNTGAFATVDDIVWALEAESDAVYVGGDFTTFEGLPRQGIAAVARAAAVSTPVTNLISDSLSLETFPNPMRERAVVRLTVPSVGAVRMALYDVRGRRVRTMLERTMPAGVHDFSLSTRRLAAGVYWIRLEHNERAKTKSLNVLR